MDAGRAPLELRQDQACDATWRRAGLAQALDAEVIPRLVLARRAAPVAVSLDERDAGPLLASGEVAAFTQLVRELSPAFCDAAQPQYQTRRALLVPAHGEQHTFGLYMVAEFLRRAGWDVAAGPVASTAEMLVLLRDQWYAVVGISVSCDVRLEGLAAAIHAIRRASRNRGIGVMVGGPAFLERPELAALVGADASAVDGRQAALQAESLLALAARRA